VPRVISLLDRGERAEILAARDQQGFDLDVLQNIGTVEVIERALHGAIRTYGDMVRRQWMTQSDRQYFATSKNMR
jgi:hypothetical protein